MLLFVFWLGSLGNKDEHANEEATVPLLGVDGPVPVVGHWSEKELRMQHKHVFRSLVVAALAIAFFSVGTSQADPPGALGFGRDDLSLANVGFGSAVSDDEILHLLERHNAVPRAAFMWISGLTGTHRTYEAKDVSTFLKEARAETVETFRKSLRGNRRQLRHFVKMHAEEKVISDDDLQIQSRSLLNIRATLKAGLAAAQKGEPLIYAMEVGGDAASLERLMKEERVRTSGRAKTIGNRIVVPGTLKPEAYEAEFLDPDVQAMSTQDLYRRIKALAEGIGKK